VGLPEVRRNTALIQSSGLNSKEKLGPIGPNNGQKELEKIIEYLVSTINYNIIGNWESQVINSPCTIGQEMPIINVNTGWKCQ
jgi:hypothetical protein